jgi:serine/threonine-protein kinase RsbW
MIHSDPAFAYHDAPPSHCPRENWKRVEIHAVHDLPPVRRVLIAEMTTLGYPAKDRFAVELALREAVVNAVDHGHGGDPSRTVLVVYHVNPAEVLLEVADEGPGFNPYRVPNPLAETYLWRASGRGLFLLRVYMTWIRFNRRGNRVILCKKRSEA